MRSFPIFYHPTQAKGTVEKVPYDFKSKERGGVGTALVAVLLRVRTGTSPVPTNSNSSITSFSTVPKAFGYHPTLFSKSWEFPHFLQPHAG